MAKILYVEDDIALGREVKEWLEEVENLKVEFVSNGEDALQLLDGFTFDLIILDWELPGLSGLSLCQRYREAGGQTPILFLTGRSELSDKELGFGNGADDYLTKPYNVRELAMRCKALLRRARQPVSFSCRKGTVVLKPADKLLFVEKVPVSLTALECSLLTFLFSHPSQPFSSAALVKAVWPSEKGAAEESVRSLIRTLRQKLDQLNCEATKDLIETVNRGGYMYRP